MKASAQANANIALTKYWGKRDKELMLPQNGSISVTLEGLVTKTTVEFQDDLKKDILILNNTEYTEGEEYEEVVEFINLVREMSGIDKKAKIASINEFPTAAGLASSASGFAALAVAASTAANLKLDDKELSMLARRGSGSATRSILEGFSEWTRGEKDDGTDSYAVPIASKSHWPEFRIIVAVTQKTEKKVKSRAGMAQTIENCPLYQAWLDTVNDDMDVVRKAIKDRDFTTLGERAELNALKMHATMMTTTPHIFYWTPSTLAIMHAIMEWREKGLECYFTIDGGPQVKIICLEKDQEEIIKRLKTMNAVEDIIECRPGDAAKVINEHLF